jgi:type IX secretion system substrate protein
MGKYFYVTFFLVAFLSLNLSANCPGCVIDVPAGMAADTLFIAQVPNGTANAYFDEDVSFRMPMTTTPVNQTDPSIPAGLDITSISILSISNLPPGLSWETNATSYDPQTETDGCFKFCGTPLVPGLYIVEVTVEATVVIISQEVTFPMEILILPAFSTNDGFSMTNNSGCGEVIVSFENNIPSGGNTGFDYNWDFGNGNSSLDENPSDQTYSQPGTYIVNYQATIDTIGYILTRVGVNNVSCFDIPTFPDFSDKPDLHVEITDPNGNLIFSSPTVPNTDPPIEVFPNIMIGAGQYEMRVIDQDSGINGADDVCGEISFNQLSNGIFSTSEFELELEVLHPVDTIITSDTIIVYDIPDQPVVFNSGADEFCAGETVVLTSSYDENNQWYFDGEMLSGETGISLEVFESGIYQVTYTSMEGCTSVSEETIITINENPVIPEYSNTNNLLSLLGFIDYGPNISYQWYQDGVLLQGETMPEYCALEDANYTLEVTDTNTGCISIYTQSIDYDENLNCFSASEDLASDLDLKIFPNPVTDWINISLNLSEAATLEIRFYDMLGRLHHDEVLTRYVDGFTQLQPISVERLPAGIHFIELRFGDKSIIQKFVKN